MMRMDRYAVVAGLGFPVLLLTLGMLARTELFIGDRVRTAVERQARARGADIEVLTVGPSGLFGIELDRVSARIPRGDFAIEIDVESIVVTPTFASLFGEVEIESVEVNRGIVALVPWQTSPAKPSTPSPKSSVKPARPAEKKAAKPIEVTLSQLDVIALNDAYRSQPLQLARAEFTWQRGTPVTHLAAYGNLPDGVPFSLGVSEDSGREVYRVQPQTRTSVDRWVSPTGAGIAWPFSMQVRDIRLCPSCEDVVVLEDIELAVPAWRKDVRVTAPMAAVSRSGSDLTLGAPEMAIVDAATREFAVRITESGFRYAVDSGHLDGRLDFAADDGGTLGTTWSWDAEDFVVDFKAKRFPLSDVWHLVPLGERAKPERMDGTARVGWDMRHRTLRLQSDLQLTHLALDVPFTNETIDLAEGRFELDAFVDAGGRAFSVRRAALSLGDGKPFVGSLRLVDAFDGVAFDGTLTLPEQPAALLLKTLPPQWTEAARGAVLEGTYGFEISAAGHSAYPESLVLEAQTLGKVVVVSDGAANVKGVGLSGPPPGHKFAKWTSLSQIGVDTWEVVLAAEDAKFMQHDGFDWAGFERAMVHNLKARRPERGGSTISQQVSKNVFLSGKRTLARKLQEAYLTWRLESVLPKKRILEIYLNIAEWGVGVRGIGAAADHYFDEPASKLAPVEVAVLAAILPNPGRFGGWIDQGKFATSRLEKVEHILRNLRFLKKITGEQYQTLWTAAKRGEFGRLRLSICDDRGRDEAPPCTGR